MIAETFHKGTFVNATEIFSTVQHHLDNFEIALNKKLHSNIPLAETVVRYVADKRGKRLRPLLVFLTAEMHGTPNDVTMASSLVIELLHTATLVHDDVVDDSELRRGHPTVNSLWNSKISILVGDFLFSKTLSTMVDLQSIQALAILSDSANQITEGELLQMDQEYLNGLNESIYYELITKKTASLFSASCQLGALSVSADELAIKRMGLLGENLGIAFQITDDLLDYIGDEKILGKPVGNDIREHKITLPLIFALNKAEAPVKEKILAHFDNGTFSDKEIKHIIDFAHDYGGIEYTKQTANTFANKASSVLTAYPDSEYNQTLKQLVAFSINRDV